MTETRAQTPGTAGSTPRPVALVTGASSGIGAAFARTLAASGHDLVLVARDRARLDALAAELTAAHPGAQCEVLPADLADAAQCAAVERRLADATRPVALLVNNAGLTTKGDFARVDVEDEERVLAVNVRAVVRLTRAAVPGMLERHHGGVINISSVAGFLAGARGSTYSASKAYVTNFSQSLHAQLVGSGVTVTAVCPGFTHTEFHQRAGMTPEAIPRWMWLTAEQVVSAGLSDHRAGRALSVPGRRYQVIVAGARLVPTRLLDAASRGVRGRTG